MTSRSLPPGQIETGRFPVVGERKPSADIAEWSLAIDGLVNTPRVLDLDDYLALDHSEVRFDIHCVTSWTRLGARFTGVPLSQLVDPADGARFASFAAYSERGHNSSLPLGYAMEHSWVVHAFEGEPLTVEHGGPVRVVTPGKYFYKSIKWLRRVELLAEDRLGWWETHSAYHNNADPMPGNQRFTTGSVRPEQLRRFLEADNFDKYRGRVTLGLDLRGWAPKSLDLRRLYLKNCDLSGVDLTGADLRGSNLSLSNLRGVRLAGADLSGSDLEGADLTDADLRDADLSGCALSATRFEGARVARARFDGAWGLVESEALYLRSSGVSIKEA